MDRIRALLAALALACVGLGAAPAGAQAKLGKKECAAAYVQAQKLSREDKLRDARVQLELCLNPACPAGMVKDCRQWSSEVEAAMAGVVLVVRGPDGSALSDADVQIDGQRISLPADGSIELEPGTHQFRVEAPGLEPVEQAVTLARGEKKKQVELAFAKKVERVAAPPPVEAPPPPKPTRRVTPVMLVLGGVGVVGITGFAYFGLTGKSDESDLKSRCAPNCDQGDVDAAHRKLLIADISLGIGLAALGVGTYLYLKAPSGPAIGLSPTRGGGTLSAQGNF